MKLLFLCAALSIAASAQNYSAWLNEDAAYIITDQERAAFLRLQTDGERNQFIESFWLRRDPTPDTIENEFRDEHYRRIAYANDVFAAAIPGWKTDRGRIYILNNNPTQKEPAPEGIRVFVGPVKPRATKFPDLQARVDSRILLGILPMKVRVDFIPVTNATVPPT